MTWTVSLFRSFCYTRVPRKSSKISTGVKRQVGGKYDEILRSMAAKGTEVF